MTRRSRYATALLVVAALLFGPLAMAANACPHANAVAALKAMGDMPCHERQLPAGPNLCDTEFQSAPVSFDAAKPVTPPAVAILELPRVAVLHPALMRAASQGYDQPGPAPPLTRFTVLRI